MVVSLSRTKIMNISKNPLMKMAGSQFKELEFFLVAGYLTDEMYKQVYEWSGIEYAVETIEKTTVSGQKLT